MRRRIFPLIGCAIFLAAACNLQAGAEFASTAASSGPKFSTPTSTVPADGSSPTPTDTPTPEASPTPTREYPYTIREQTLYEGEKTYTCDPNGCWRDDGTVNDSPEYFYPDIGMENAEIDALLSSIGLPSSAAADNAERWRRIRELWKWMTRNTIIIGEPGYEEPWNYLLELTPDRWPSIGEMAKVFARYNVLPLGACNSKAFTMATLLYRVGVLPDWITVAHSMAHNGTQHLYLGIQLDGRWRYLDPTCIREHTALAPQPETVGCVGADYAHPYELVPLPGSQLTKPMLLE
jgi:hypothetical protein